VRHADTVAFEEAAPPVGEAANLTYEPPSASLDWLVSPISLDACASSLGMPLARLVKAAEDGRLRAVKRGEHWFTDRGVWAAFRAEHLG
jgi:hypothetical protein